MNFFVLCIIVVLCDLVCAEDPIKYFLRDMNTTVEGRVSVNEKLKELAGFTHYRLVPGDFSYGKYHFDGLATVMKFSFETNSNGDVEASYFAKPYESEAYQDKDNHKCVFFGTGIGPFVRSVRARSARKSLSKINVRTHTQLQRKLNSRFALEHRYTLFFRRAVSVS